MTLGGSKALIIGAATQPGRVIALALADAGASVALAAASLDADEVMTVRRTRRTIVSRGGQAAEYAFDVTLGQNVVVSTRQATKQLGGLDILVTAQDYFLGGPLEKLSDADWSRLLALNLSGVFYACRAAVREMGSGGSIINIVPALTRHGGPDASAYDAAKSGVIGLSKSMALEYASRGIHVNVLEYYPAQIEGAAASGPRPVSSAADANPKDDREMGELGSTAVYLASTGADGPTGQLIRTQLLES